MAETPVRHVAISPRHGRKMCDVAVVVCGVGGGGSPLLCSCVPTGNLFSVILVLMARWLETKRLCFRSSLENFRLHQHSLTMAEDLNLNVKGWIIVVNQ